MAFRLPFFSRFGYFYRDQAPQWMWDNLKNGTRKNKDITAPLMSLLNKTRIYETLLKSHAGYWVFVMSSSVVVGAAWCEGFDRMWDRVNAGKQYKDLPYTYPKEDDE